MSQYSAEEAARWHCSLTRHTWEILQTTPADHRQLWVAGEWDNDGPAHPWFAEQGFPIQSMKQQPEGDLGARMISALRDGITYGSSPDRLQKRKVLLTGSDCAVLSPQILEQAFDVLEQSNTVFIPAEDGGFVLIGCSIILPEDLFKGLHWGHHRVLEETLARLNQLNITYQLLPELWDIDHPEDLQRWEKLNNQHS